MKIGKSWNSMGLAFHGKLVMSCDVLLRTLGVDLKIGESVTGL